MLISKTLSPFCVISVFKNNFLHSNLPLLPPLLPKPYPGDHGLNKLKSTLRKDAFTQLT